MNETNKIYTENDFLSAYIGEDVTQYNPNNKNWKSAGLGQFIGPIWFFYRKSYLLGFGFIVLTFIIGYLSSSFKVLQAYYLMGFLYLLLTNPLYLWDVKRKVKKIRADNFSRSDSEIMEILERKGGRSKLAATIYVIFLVLFIISLFLLMTLARSQSMYY